MLALGQRLVDTDNHVQMVGHETYLPNIYHWIIMVNLWYLITEDGLPKRIRFETGRFAAGPRGACYLPEYRTPVGNDYRYFVSSLPRIVVSIHASCLTTFACHYR